MYNEIADISAVTIAQLKGIVIEVPWEVHVSDVTAHEAAPCDHPLQSVPEIVDRWPIDTWQNLSFLRLRPGGKLYRHADSGFGFHIPVETNDDAVSLTYPDGIEMRQHLEVGKLYRVERSIEHESFNDGNTDRTHLIVLLKDSGNG